MCAHPFWWLAISPGGIWYFRCTGCTAICVNLMGEDKR